jgi:hypothetical protein
MKRSLFAALLLAPRAASACAICFGAVDTNAGFYTGLSWAILTLLVVVLSLVGGIGYAMYSVEREREREHAGKKA